jgi:lysophospholipase L1-like esterase
MLLLELGTRMTKTGLYWLGDLEYALQTELTLKGADTKNWDSFKRDWADFESGQFQKYPTRAYPVSYPPRKKPVRVVCMGGSSTGGAYQFDDLDLFYPAILEQEGAGKFEVINQGVGGWTSYHMRRYLSHHLEALQPTILTFYIGNNDASRYLPADVEHLFEAMESASPSPPQVALSLLGPLRKVFFLGWMSQAVEAVPPEKLQHNLLSIASQMSTTNRKILLMTELNHPNSKRLRFHHRRLKTIAESHTGIEWWDLTKALPENTDPFFLDQTHLTVLGHQWLGEELYKKLQALGWLEVGTHE